MSDAQRPLWAQEESVEAQAQLAFAFRYWTSVENMTADPGIERVETDGPFRDRPGMRGRTYLVGGGTTNWVVTDVEPERRVVIDLALRDATLRFEMRFEERVGGGSVLTQRVSLFGPNAAEYLQGIESAFGTSLRDGMAAVRDRIDEAARASRVRVRPYEPRDRDFVLFLVPLLTDAGPPLWRTARQMIETDQAVVSQALDGALPASVVLVAEAGDGRPLGFIHLCPESDYYSRAECGHIADIVVAPAERGRGVGEALMSAAQDWARGCGYRILSLNVLLANTRARQLYERLGFGPETIRCIKVLE